MPDPDFDETVEVIRQRIAQHAAAGLASHDRRT